MKRIGLLTSGGDCQALNATMRGVVKGLSSNLDELEVYGFMNGYKGLIYGDYRLLTSKDFSGIRFVFHVKPIEFFMNLNRICWDIKFFLYLWRRKLSNIV